LLIVDLGCYLTNTVIPSVSTKNFTTMFHWVKEIINWLASYLQGDAIPITISIVVIYTTLCEIWPRFITRHNSNGYTSQTLWNVTLRGLRFQIVNYYLYHTRFLAIAVHGATILLDCVLWTMYFHHLLHGNAWWAFCFVFYMCLLQALTFDDLKLKITLIAIEGLIIGGAGTLYHFYLEHTYPSGPLFGHVSLFLLLNALARVISHMPEPLPIDYLGLNNRLPIAGWYWDKTVLNYMMYLPRLLMSVFFGVISELQAGLPVRLLTSCLVLILTRIGWSDPGLNMEHLKKRADNIDKEGWDADPVGSNLFKWEFDPTDDGMQQMFEWAAAHRYHRRVREGEPLSSFKTWLRQDQMLPGSVKVE
jgi:hypothetical protein